MFIFISLSGLLGSELSSHLCLYVCWYWPKARTLQQLMAVAEFVIRAILSLVSLPGLCPWCYWNMKKASQQWTCELCTYSKCELQTYLKCGLGTYLICELGTYLWCGTYLRYLRQIRLMHVNAYKHQLSLFYPSYRLYYLTFQALLLHISILIHTEPYNSLFILHPRVWCWQESHNPDGYMPPHLPTAHSLCCRNE